LILNSLIRENLRGLASLVVDDELEPLANFTGYTSITMALNFFPLFHFIFYIGPFADWLYWTIDESTIVISDEDER
jgi:hypothetical protein